jgi:hypothetical protein
LTVSVTATHNSVQLDSSVRTISAHHDPWTSHFEAASPSACDDEADPHRGGASRVESVVAQEGQSPRRLSRSLDCDSTHGACGDQELFGRRTSKTVVATIELQGILGEFGTLAVGWLAQGLQVVMDRFRRVSTGMSVSQQWDSMGSWSVLNARGHREETFDDIELPQHRRREDVGPGALPKEIVGDVVPADM